tara:strand:- start:5 stop:394 length:390 start_codon:yes stop_codon:yes gene_type:complete
LVDFAGALRRGSRRNLNKYWTAAPFPNVDSQLGSDEIVIFNGSINIGARWPGQNYEAGLGLVGRSLVLARFFFGSFLFINGKEMNGKPQVSGINHFRKPNFSSNVYPVTVLLILYFPISKDLKFGSYYF